MLEQAVVGCLWPAAEEQMRGKMNSFLGLPLWDSDDLGLPVVSAEVYLDGSIVLDISYHLFPAHVYGSSEACCYSEATWQYGYAHMCETNRLQDKGCITIDVSVACLTMRFVIPVL